MPTHPTAPLFDSPTVSMLREIARRATGLADDFAGHDVGYRLPASRAERTDEARMLAAVADEVLTATVVADRRGGASWATIGERLGMSKQAAHERFRPAEAADQRARSTANL